MFTRRRFLEATAGAAVLVRRVRPANAQEGVFMAPQDAPRSLFPDATDVDERAIPSTPALKAQVRGLLGQPPSVWEDAYRVFTVKREGHPLGFVVIVDEIGKHRPITFAVAVRPDGTVHDVAVLAYREPYGGEVRERRFLKQYAGRTATAPLQPYRDIQNIAGATLSVNATGRAVKKAVAVLRATGDLR
jgi:hypothetical protein